MDNAALKRPSRPLGRIEDEQLLRGGGHFTADLAQGALVARFARASVAHARIASLHLEAARAMDGVEAVLAMPDLQEVLPRQPRPIDTVKNRDGSTTPVPGRPALADERIRFAGEAYALVIARSEAQASDAVEAIVAEFEELPTVSDLETHRTAITPLHEDCPNNLGFDWAGGDEAGTAEMIKKAEYVVRARIRVPRILGAPLEPFACLASYDVASGVWTLVTPSQGVHAMRRELADGYLDIPHDRLHVITPDVGGGFGIRIHMLPEQATLLAAAKLLGESIAWRSDRSESNLCEPHARDLLIKAELALDTEGCFLGLRADGLCNLGAYVHPGARTTPTASLMFGLHGAYRMPALSLRMRGFYTNTTPTGPFRGAGQPEGTYVLERLIDQAANELNISRIEIRRRNALGAGDRNHKAVTGHVVYSCDALAVLNRACAWLDQPRKPLDACISGKGLAVYLKVNGMGRQEKAVITVDPQDGRLTAFIGSQSNGQGHATTFAALAAERLGLPVAQVRIVQGDTRQIRFGTGTGASGALGTTGTGVSRSCADLLDKARALAIAHLDVSAEQIEYASGSFRVIGSNRFVTLRELAASSTDGLVGRSEVGISLTYTVGCHACVVAIDRETGLVEVTDYAAFDDLGPLLQPIIAAGQIHGGVVQGIGQALHEGFHYDRDTAQPISATFMDYQLPRASDVPIIEGHIAQTPDAGTDLGVRGAGEAGAIASMAAVVNAVADALGVASDVQAPLTPQEIWQCLTKRRAEGRNGDGARSAL
jgi:carbon-monoxide dehydrogenase large subunit